MDNLPYVSVHYLDDHFNAAFNKVCQASDAKGIRVIEFYPDLGTADTVVREVEAPTEEASLCWVTAVNALCRADCCHQVLEPDNRSTYSRYAEAAKAPLR